ncbi:hypothetical protein [Pseudomonas koreensis]|uniref:hypothetical protein n=1 Tax=Pseudomonas koreensis TaxID=198620 RepID=UPI00078B90D8|nr:hypothetical protein [Pseudomonas koreensis]AMT88359.1 hypothetical protein AYO71_12680 [Pseudomonas koreensis]
MSEAKKLITRWSRDFQGNLQEDPNGSWVLAADAAIRDKRLMDKIDQMQQRLTAADEREDVLEGLIGEVLDAVGREPLDLDAVLRLRARMRAALKPAEVGADSCEFCKGWGFRSNPDGADEGCGACNGTGKEPSDDQQ